MKGGVSCHLIKTLVVFANEKEFYEYLNHKKVKELNPVFRDLFNVLFDNLKEEDIIKATLNITKQKSDLYIRINGITKGISIKKRSKKLCAY